MQDLSKELLGGEFPAVTGGSSMSAANGVSPKPPFGAPGSASEATTNEDATGTLGPVIPDEVNKSLVIDFGTHHPNLADPYHLDQPDQDSGRWTVAPQEDTPGRSGTGPWTKV